MKDAVSDFVFRMTGGNKAVAELCAEAVACLEEGDVCLPLDEERSALLASVPGVAFFAAADTPPGAVRTPFVVGPDPGGAAGLLYTRRNWVYERRVRDWILGRIGAPPADSVPELPDEPFYNGLRDEQRDAVLAMCNSRFSILTGGPGTGKTHTIARAVKFVLDRRPEFRLGLAAPTGKAKARMAESLEKAVKDLGFDVPQASTIHSLLGPKPDFVTFKHDRNNPLSLDWLVVDEASMVDLPLMAKLLDALPDSCRLTLVGDADQLASVERGRVFGDLCRFPGVPVSRLGQSARFPPDGDIAKLAAAVNGRDADGAMAVLGDRSDVVSFVDLARLSKDDAFDPEKWPGFADRVLAGFATFAGGPNGKDGEPEDPVEFALAHLNDFRVLCALRHGPFGSEQVARWIKKRLPRNSPVPMMVTKNDRGLGVENGDVGVVMPDDPKTLRLPGGRNVRLELLPDPELAFASTVHKAQGSEFDDVAIVLPPNPSGKKPGKDAPPDGGAASAEGEEEGNACKLLTREILYTAITRTKKTVALWGSAESVRHCALNGISRRSGLVFPAP